MKKLLWLDDFRNPYENVENKVPTGEWTIIWVKNYKEFITIIQLYGLPDAVSFDHDLADEHYTPQEYWNDYVASKQYQDEVSKNYQEKTGFDCAKWLVEYCMDNNCNFPEWYIHSANPVGADNIRILIKNFHKHWNI